MVPNRKMPTLATLTLILLLLFTSSSCSPEIEPGLGCDPTPTSERPPDQETVQVEPTPYSTSENPRATSNPNFPSDYKKLHYVSKTGDNSDGKTWWTAWNELDQIDWLAVSAGDVILLDGGVTEMVYTTPLVIHRIGKPEKPITIKLAEKPGRDGKAILFGGRSTPLPYCGQFDYSPETLDPKDIGISILDKSWVVIDGTKFLGIKIHGFSESGITLDASSSHITVRNVEITDNGSARGGSGGWETNNPGVRLAGSDILFEKVVIHDNGQDAFQSGEGVTDFTLRQSWLYNLRRHPNINEAFNYCSHTDGLQIYGGGTQSGILIEESIIGPGFAEGIILGQTTTSNGDHAIVNNVTLRNVLFTKSTHNSIMGYPGIKSSGWVIDHVTSYCPNTKWQCLFLEGYGHTVTNSIFVGSNLYLPDGLSDTSNNCQWNTTGYSLGEYHDPEFLSVNENNPFSLDDYTIPPGTGCAGLGSTITSVEQLFRLSNTLVETAE